MLVLTRKVGEGIKIGDDVFIRIKEVKGKQVRIGIEAPRETRIQREELEIGKDAKSQETSQIEQS